MWVQFGTPPRSISSMWGQSGTKGGYNPQSGTPPPFEGYMQGRSGTEHGDDP